MKAMYGSDDAGDPGDERKREADRAGAPRLHSRADRHDGHSDDIVEINGNGEDERRQPQTTAQLVTVPKKRLEQRLHALADRRSKEETQIGSRKRKKRAAKTDGGAKRKQSLSHEVRNPRSSLLFEE